MSGKFASVGMDEDGVVRAYTHGCTCCSNRIDEVSVAEIDEHIAELNSDLARALNLRDKMLAVQAAVKKALET